MFFLLNFFFQSCSKLKIFRVKISNQGLNQTKLGSVKNFGWTKICSPLAAVTKSLIKLLGTPRALLH